MVPSVSSLCTAPVRLYGHSTSLYHDELHDEQTPSMNIPRVTRQRRVVRVDVVKFVRFHASQQRILRGLAQFSSKARKRRQRTPSLKSCLRWLYRCESSHVHVRTACPSRVETALVSIMQIPPHLVRLAEGMSDATRSDIVHQRLTRSRGG